MKIDGNSFSKMSSMITILSLGIAPAWYFWKKNQDERHTRVRSSKNLYLELDDALKALDTEKYPDDFKKVMIDDGKCVYFMNRGLNHDFYDSLIFSGNINFLRPEIQQQIQDIFQRIKDHNRHIRKIRDIEDNANDGSDILHKTKRYYEILSQNECVLLEKIPEMKKTLEEICLYE